MKPEGQTRRKAKEERAPEENVGHGNQTLTFYREAELKDTIYANLHMK